MEQLGQELKKVLKAGIGAVATGLEIGQDALECLAGLPADRAAWAAVDAEIKAAGCRGALLACTELSVIKAEEHLDDYYTDPMEVMAERAIEFMGKQVK